jgi:hypothetical protein
MNGKKVLLLTMLLGAGISTASAQGLVGAPVDPRYGQCNSVDGCSSNPATGRTQRLETGKRLLIVVMIALRVVRL